MSNQGNDIKLGLTKMGLGILIAGIGVAVTAISYSLVSSKGGTYMVAWGAMAVGAWRVLLGLFQLFRGLVSAKTGSVDPSTLRSIGILLLIQAIGKIGLLIYDMDAAALDRMINAPQQAIMSLGLPGLFILGGIIAGGLLLAKASIARSFGLVFCATALVHLVYLVGKSVYVSLTLLSAYTSSVFAMFWIFNGVQIMIYITALIVIARAGRSDDLAQNQAAVRA